MITSTLSRDAQAGCSSSARSPACPHVPPCPAATAPDRDAARTVAAHPEQGWSLLCNGVVLFDDTGELLPDGRQVPPRRPGAPMFTGSRDQYRLGLAGAGAIPPAASVTLASGEGSGA
jgi:hypothetical protein